MTWPLIDSAKSQTGGVNTANGNAITLTASGTPHNKGAWSELITAADIDYTGIWIFTNTGVSVSATDTSTLLDVGFGAAASEVSVVGEIGLGFANSVRAIYLPLYVPAGTRVSARIQSVVVSETLVVWCMLVGGGGYGPPLVGRQAVTYGANTGTSGGVAMTVPGAANTKGAWTQITASTTAPIRWLLACVMGPAGDNNITNQEGLVDIGVGGAGAEVVVIANIKYSLSGAEALTCHLVSVPVWIPTATRLAARYQQSAGNDTPNIILIGFA